MLILYKISSLAFFIKIFYDLIKGIKMNANALDYLKSDIPDFKAGDTVKVYAKIVEGNKERI